MVSPAAIRRTVPAGSGVALALGAGEGADDGSEVNPGVGAPVVAGGANEPEATAEPEAAALGPGLGGTGLAHADSARTDATRTAARLDQTVRFIAHILVDAPATRTCAGETGQPLNT
jgi:hypothetical protein